MNLQALPEDTTNYLFSLLTSKERANACLVSKWFEVAMIKVSMKLSPTPELYHWNPLRKLPKKKCDMISPRDYHLIVRLKQIDRMCFPLVCKEGDIDVIGLFIDHADDIVYTEGGLTVAVKSGRMDVVKILMDVFIWSNDEYIRSMESACRAGNMELLKRISEKVKQPKQHILAHCFASASKYGHIDIVEYLNDKYVGNFWNVCLIGAAKGGNTEMISYAWVFAKPENEVNRGWSLNEALRCACQYGQQEAVTKLIELGATYCDNCNKFVVDH